MPASSAREGRPSTASLGSTTVIFINTRRVVVSGQGLTPASSGSSRLILPGDLHTREQQVLRLVVWGFNNLTGVPAVYWRLLGVLPFSLLTHGG